MAIIFTGGFPSVVSKSGKSQIYNMHRRLRWLWFYKKLRLKRWWQFGELRLTVIKLWILLKGKKLV